MSGLSQLPPEIRALRPVKTLEANFEKGRLAHAILLKGDDLALLESVAKGLAATILKAKGDPEGYAGLDWTDGCIAVTNPEIEELLHAIKDGTPIEILP